MVRELAKTPDWAYRVLRNGSPEDPERAKAEQEAEMASWADVA